MGTTASATLRRDQRPRPQRGVVSSADPPRGRASPRGARPGPGGPGRYKMQAQTATARAAAAVKRSQRPRSHRGDGSHVGLTVVPVPRRSSRPGSAPQCWAGGLGRCRFKLRPAQATTVMATVAAKQSQRLHSHRGDGSHVGLTVVPVPRRSSRPGSAPQCWAGGLGRCRFKLRPAQATTVMATVAAKQSLRLHSHRGDGSPVGLTVGQAPRRSSWSGPASRRWAGLYRVSG